MQCMEGQQSETRSTTSASSSSYTVTVLPANHTTNHTKHHDQFLSLDSVRHHMTPDLLLWSRMHDSMNLLEGNPPPKFAPPPTPDVLEESTVLCMGSVHRWSSHLTKSVERQCFYLINYIFHTRKKTDALAMQPTIPTFM